MHKVPLMQKHIGSIVNTSLKNISYSLSMVNGLTAIPPNGYVQDNKDEMKGVEIVSANLESMRKNYFNQLEPFLLEQNMDLSPFRQFDLWFKGMSDQVNSVSEEINAVALSTIGANNRPSSRMVLLKRYDENGFSFFTHSISRKGKDLAGNPNASMLFYWPMVTRQIRIEGTVKIMDPKIANDYWYTRPIGSRIGSKISKQSSTISSRENRKLGNSKR